MSQMDNAESHSPLGDSESLRAETAGLILCGGQSSRMGLDKAALRMRGGPLLGRSLENMSKVANVVVLSVGQHQTLPAIPALSAKPELADNVLVIRDTQAYQGPLIGLAEGFRALQGKASRVVVMPVDMPFYTVPWMSRLLRELQAKTQHEGAGGSEDGNAYRACLYRHEGFINALTGAYALDLLPKLEALIAEGKRRPVFLSQGEPTCVLDGDVDQPPGTGHPLSDMDTPDAYRDALLREDIGRPGGKPVSVTLLGFPGDPGPANGPEDEVEHNPEHNPETTRNGLYLYANTAADVLRAIPPLYPELFPEVHQELTAKLTSGMAESGIRLTMIQAATVQQVAENASDPGDASPPPMLPTGLREEGPPLASDAPLPRDCHLVARLMD